MSEKYENLRRNRDLANWNQRRFEQEVAEEIGVGREGSRTTKPGQPHTGGPGTVPGGRTGKETEHGGGTTGGAPGSTGPGPGQRPRC